MPNNLLRDAPQHQTLDRAVAMRTDNHHVSRFPRHATVKPLGSLDDRPCRRVSARFRRNAPRGEIGAENIRSALRYCPLLLHGAADAIAHAFDARQRFVSPAVLHGLRRQPGVDHGKNKNLRLRWKSGGAKIG